MKYIYTGQVLQHTLITIIALPIIQTGSSNKIIRAEPLLLKVTIQIMVLEAVVNIIHQTWIGSGNPCREMIIIIKKEAPV
jgi:hypothetical protein